MSKYLDRLKKFSKNKNLIYADKPWFKAIAHVEQLEKENAELKSKVERLENCIHTLHHEEYSYSPYEVKRYIKQIYTGQHDQYFRKKIRECLKEWGQGE